MPDNKKYSTKDKIDWLEKHIHEVRKETADGNFRDMLPIKAHLSALTALKEAAAREGEAPEPLPCNGCTFFGRGYANPCGQCCRGKRDLLAEARAKAEQRGEGAK